MSSPLRTSTPSYRQARAVQFFSPLEITARLGNLCKLKEDHPLAPPVLHLPPDRQALGEVALGLFQLAPPLRDLAQNIERYAFIAARPGLLCKCQASSIEFHRVDHAPGHLHGVPVVEKQPEEDVYVTPPGL
jgi:hypothetical protein